MKFPKTGTYVRVYWLDAQCATGWEYEDEEDGGVIELSHGMFRGVTKEARARIAPTVSFNLTENGINGKLTELLIPTGCIVRVEKLPQPIFTNPKSCVTRTRRKA